MIHIHISYTHMFFLVILLDWVNGTAVVALIPITLRPYFFSFWEVIPCVAQE